MILIVGWLDATLEGSAVKLLVEAGIHLFVCFTLAWTKSSLNHPTKDSRFDNFLELLRLREARLPEVRMRDVSRSFLEDRFEEDGRSLIECRSLPRKA